MRQEPEEFQFAFWSINRMWFVFWKLLLAAKRVRRKPGEMGSPELWVRWCSRSTDMSL